MPGLSQEGLLSATTLAYTVNLAETPYVDERHFDLPLPDPARARFIRKAREKEAWPDSRQHLRTGFRFAKKLEFSTFFEGIAPRNG